MPGHMERDGKCVSLARLAGAIGTLYNVFYKNCRMILLVSKKFSHPTDDCRAEATAGPKDMTSLGTETTKKI